MVEKFAPLLEKYGVDIWVIYHHENSDPYFKKFFFTGVDTQTYCIISQQKIYLFVCGLDYDNLKYFPIQQEDVVVYRYDTNEEFNTLLEDVIDALKFPTKVAISYSTMGDRSMDILTHGDYIALTKLLKIPYRRYGKKVSFPSAENILYELTSQKTLKQQERLQELAAMTVAVLANTFENIKIGKTEKEIVSLTNTILDKKMKKWIHSQATDIIDFAVAWENCPIVLTGENLAKGGHSLPSDKKLLPGDTIYFDFGIQAKYNDGEVLYTDIQRMGYALKEGESKPPKTVQKVFDVLVSAIETGIEEMRPGVKGYTIDNIVRKRILRHSYPDYNHATGHPVGLEVHDTGAVISLRSSKRANLPLVENGIYTLEPRVNISNGGSIEEMIMVTKFGGIPLCETQKEMYLVK